MRGPRRSGTTLVESLVAFGLLATVLGSALAVLTLSRRQGDAVTRHSSRLRAVALARAQLEEDLAALRPPIGMALCPVDIRLREDGRELRFLRTPPSRDPEAAPPRGGPALHVRWVVVEALDGSLLLLRRQSGPGGILETRFEGAPLSAAAFRLRRHAGRHYLEAELEVGAPEDPPGARLPLRVARALPTAAHLSRTRRGTTPATVRAAVPESETPTRALAAVPIRVTLGGGP